MTSTISFSFANLFIGVISEKGPEGAFFYNTGSLVFTSAYFVIMADCWKKKEKVGLLEIDIKEQRLLLTKWNGRVDWYKVLLFVVGGCFQAGIFFSICYTFMLSQMAGLNIGIA